MNGLHVCKPENAPTVGQVKNFAVIQMPAKGDKKTWTKFKNEMPDKGGSPHKILSVTPADFYSDSYGNIAFNLEIEPTGGGVDPGYDPRHRQAQSTQVDRGSVGTMSKDDYWRNKDQRDLDAIPRITRSHSQEMALRYWTLLNAAGSITQEALTDTKKLRELTDWFQRDVGHVPETAPLPEPESEETF